MKEFKNKSEQTKNQMGSENYEAASEELKKDEKKLGVSSSFPMLFNPFFIFQIEHHQEARKSIVCGFSLVA